MLRRSKLISLQREIKIDATAISKGKGFQGAIKRHGQSRGPMTHGSKFHRHAGSNGAASDPSKVFKGKKMPGQMGNKKITVQNLEIVRVDAENNLLPRKRFSSGTEEMSRNDQRNSKRKLS